MWHDVGCGVTHGAWAGWDGVALSVGCAEVGVGGLMAWPRRNAVADGVGWEGVGRGAGVRGRGRGANGSGGVGQGRVG